MHRVTAPALVIVGLLGCAGEGSAPGSASNAAEVPMSRDENIANHTNTVIKAKFANGDRSESVFDANNTVRSTYTWKDGSESNEGTWTLKDDHTICLTWKKKNWEDSCWSDYKAGDQYVAYEQGGKKRKVRFTVTPR
jgi:hypothetical protein